MQKILNLDIRGASHAKKMTFSLGNFPAGVFVDAGKIAEFMERRAPGRDSLSTARRESDEVKWISGIDSNGFTTGGTIVGEIASRDMRPQDYGAERTIPRPGHADFGQWIEMGRARCAFLSLHGAAFTWTRQLSLSAARLPRTK